MIAQSIAGLVVFTGIAWLISENRKKVRLKIIIAGIASKLGFLSGHKRSSVDGRLCYESNPRTMNFEP